MITFEEWRTIIFGHAPRLNSSVRHWTFTDGTSFPHLPPAVTVAYMTELFERAGELRDMFTPRQIADGLEFLINPSYSNEFFEIFTVRSEERERCLEAIFKVYELLFAPSCDAELCSGDNHPPANPLNGICYMWWELIPIPPGVGHPEMCEMTATCLHVLEKVLRLESMACQESALHGLGHLELWSGGEVRRIIDTWLSEVGDRLSQRLKWFAEDARVGRIQ